MTTTKKRVNISLSKTEEGALEKLAKRDSMPVATKAMHLIRQALEIEEDMIWDKIANGRDKKSATFVSHNKAWA